MQTLHVPRQHVNTLLQMLGSGARFEVLARLPGNSLPAAFVLLRFGWSWGHFSRAAFCAVIEADNETVEVRVSHLTVQRMWYGSNPFSPLDQKIEDEICEYIRKTIPEAETTPHHLRDQPV